MLRWADGAPMVLSHADGRPVIPAIELSQALDIHSRALDALDVFFISCATCLDLKGVHNPRKSWIRKHVGATDYGDDIRSLGFMIGCPPKISEVCAFMATLEVKSVTRIRDPSEIIDMSIIPADNVMILQNGEEVVEYCRFFQHEPYIVRRNRAQYPEGPLSEHDAWTMPFASVMNPPLLARNSRKDLVCPEYLLDFSAALPEYESESEDVTKPLKFDCESNHYSLKITSDYTRISMDCLSFVWLRLI